MPELPEVEVFRQFAERHALGHPIQAVHVFQPKILKGLPPTLLQKTVTGRQFQKTMRRGKYLFLGLDAPQAPWLLFHFGMTGYFSRFMEESNVLTAYGDRFSEAKHVRVRFDLASGTRFAFHEQRMFGKLSLVDDPAAYLQALRLGPDALSVSKTEFTERLRRRKGLLKPALMDQTRVAGIGNVYADEIMYQCCLHPLTPVQALSDQTVQCLYEQMVTVLQTTVDLAADRDRLPDGYLSHVRHKRGRCPREGNTFEIQQIGGRTTYFCPACQPVATELADV